MERFPLAEADVGIPKKKAGDISRSWRVAGPYSLIVIWIDSKLMIVKDFFRM